MGEHNEETQHDTPNLGVSARTDVGGITGTQGDTSSSEQPQAEPRQATAGEPPTTTDKNAQTEPAKSDAGKPIGDSAPSVTDLQNQLCPNCHTGVLYVTRYDPHATHEQMQAEALASGRESGGAYDVQCFACNFSESRAFNPGRLLGR